MVTGPSPAVASLREAASDAETAVVKGVTERARETASTRYNSQVAADAAGRLIGTRRKLAPTTDGHLFYG